MRRRDHDLEPELEAFLRPRRIRRGVPRDLRARTLARARAILAAGGAIPPRAPVGLPRPLPLSVARGRRLARVALAASIAVAAGAVGALAALHVRTTATPELESRMSAPIAAAPVARGGDPSIAPPAVTGERVAATKPLRPARVSVDGDPFTAELELLQAAHAAYTRRDFSGALALVAEHARRFPKGHLTEEREALRVRSLAALGRRHEAHRAAAAFAVRFPRSILLPRLEDGADARE